MAPTRDGEKGAIDTCTRGKCAEPSGMRTRNVLPGMRNRESITTFHFVDTTNDTTQRSKNGTYVELALHSRARTRARLRCPRGCGRPCTGCGGIACRGCPAPPSGCPRRCPAPPAPCVSKKKKHCLLLCNDDWACAPEMGTRRTLMQPLMVNLSVLDRRLSMIFSHISVSTKTYWNLHHIKCE